MSSDKRLWIAGIRELQGCIKKPEQLETGVDSHSVLEFGSAMAPLYSTSLRQAGALISRKRSNYSDLT